MGVILSLMYFGGEASSLFLFIYDSLSYYKKYEKISIIFGFMFCVIFMFARIIILSPMCIYLQAMKGAPLVAKIGLIFGFYVSWKWGWMIFNKLIKGLYSNFEIKSL